ncbi:hypothetical protein A3K69_04540 [Candidatus Bathyarchaeota archaeon RBG_16_57_9]|nr:MAG: hypothetical protein A3K69_04540 [Candidatus Bathyarchaeota archaeon RBG_16_57_9]
MNNRRFAVLACIILLLLTGLILYDYRDEITEEILKIDARDKLKTPPTATFLRLKEYNISKGLVKVLTWKENRTLYEAIYNQGNDMVSMNTFTLRRVEINSTITPVLATMIAEKILSNETRFYPGHPMLSEPSVGFEKYFTDIGMWRVGWTLHVGNYSILGAGFAVRVNSATGNPRVYINSFRNVDEVSPPNPPTVTEEQALEIARAAFNDSLDSAVIDSVNVRDLGLTAPGFIGEPYQLVWEIVVQGTGIENDTPVWIGSVYLIDAYDGTILTWTSAGAGISNIQ